MKAMYISECQCNFVDNQEKLIFSFKSCNRITYLDIRKLQLASMIKGAWCEPGDITYYLYYLQGLNPLEIGEIVIFFELFDFDSEKLINHLPSHIRQSISMIQFETNDFRHFFIEGFEKNEFLSQSVEGVCSRWRYLKRAGIPTIGDLTNWTRSNLKKIRNIGDKAIDELEALLAEKGLHLKEENK